MRRFNRNERLENVHEFEMIPHNKEIAIQSVQMIDENGEIHETTKNVLVDESEEIAKIPAYTTKIEFMRQYGTLDKMGEVKFTHAPASMDEFEVEKLRNAIIANNIIRPENVKIEQPVEKPVEKPVENK